MLQANITEPNNSETQSHLSLLAKSVTLKFLCLFNIRILIAERITSSLSELKNTTSRIRKAAALAKYFSHLSVNLQENNHSSTPLLRQKAIFHVRSGSAGYPKDPRKTHPVYRQR